MKHTIVILPALLLAAAMPLSKTTADKDAADGWKTIFDGKTTNGWHTYGKSKADPQWEVKDGALHLDKSKGGSGDLVTEGVYGNFDLKLEWKISPKGNSGILFYVQEDPANMENPITPAPKCRCWTTTDIPTARSTNTVRAICTISSPAQKRQSSP